MLERKTLLLDKCLLENYLHSKIDCIKKNRIKLLQVKWKLMYNDFSFDLKIYEFLYIYIYNEDIWNQICDISNFHIYKLLVTNMTLKRFY
jgi:hypothetical protein